jgi:hypothetical protein
MRGIINKMGYKNFIFIIYNHLFKFYNLTYFIPLNKENPAKPITQQQIISDPNLNGDKLIGVHNENSY